MIFNIIQVYIVSVLFLGLYSKTTNLLMYIIPLLTGCFLVKQLLGVFSLIIEKNVKKKVSVSLKLEVLKWLHSFRPYYLQSFSGGRLLSAFYNDTNSFSELLFSITNLAIDLTSAIIIIVVMLMQNVKLALLSLMIFPIIYLFNRVIGKRIRTQTQEINAYSDRFLSNTKTLIDYIGESNVNHYFANVFTWFESLSHKLMNQILSRDKTQINMSAVNSAMNFIGYSVLLILGYNMVSADHFAPESLVVFLSYSSMLTGTLLRLVSFPSTIQPLAVSIERVFEIEDMAVHSRIQEYAKPSLQNAPNKVQLENIDMQIGNKKVLYDICLTVSLNTIVAIIGENGTGKTTLINILCGVYKPTNGRVKINNENIESINYFSYRSYINYCKYSFLPVGMTFINCILLGSKYSIEIVNKVKRLCKRLGIYETINSFPQGFDTEITSNIVLSSGQLQKIQLVRALISDAIIAVYDEPTSHLDADGAAEFYRIIEEEKHNKINIIVTHGIDGLAIFDHIYQLKNGCIIEETII